jgi:hypothetical protein
MSYTICFISYTISYAKCTILYVIHTISYMISTKIVISYVFWTILCHLCIRRHIRYRIQYHMSNVQYGMPNIQYRIRHLKKLWYHMFLVQVFAIFVYDVTYDIVYNIIIFADIICDMRKSHCYYTILYAYIVCIIATIPWRYHMPILLKTYDDTVQCHIWYCLLVPGPAFAAGRTGHAPGAPTGPASWSSALPDGLYCIVAVLTLFPSVWHVLLPMWVVTALYKQNGNFKLKSDGIAGDQVASWGQMTEWWGRWTPGEAGWARPGRARGELGEWLLVVDIQQGPVSQRTWRALMSNARVKTAPTLESCTYKLVLKVWAQEQ